MPSSELLFSFFLATAIFAYMPGPAMLYTAAQTLARGRRAGWMAAIGIHIGGYAHVLAAALGLSVLFNAVPILYAMVKFVGAAYLIWLGIKLFRSEQKFSTTSTEFKKKSLTAAFWESVSVELLNPKTAIFFLAFLPQFVDPGLSLPVWAQMMILGTIVNIMFSSADVICVLMSGAVVNFLQDTRSGGRLPQRLGGSILVALGINLAVSRQ